MSISFSKKISARLFIVSFICSSLFACGNKSALFIEVTDTNVKETENTSSKVQAKKDTTSQNSDSKGSNTP